MSKGYQIIPIGEDVTPLGGLGCINDCPNEGCINLGCGGGGDFQCCTPDPFCDCLMECYCLPNKMNCSTRIGNR